MANSPSHKWENGVIVERAVETNRWKVLPDGTPVEPDEEPATKAIESAQAENKAVKRAAKK